MFMQLPKNKKGLLLMLVGFVLLLYSLGIVGRAFILFLTAMTMIIIGFDMFGGVSKVKEMVKKK